jgi:hypothetical protein
LATVGAANIDELRQSVRAGARPKFVFFWSHEPARAGVFGSECFSQWYPAPFELDGIRFPTAEHYMMWSKARLFGDGAAAAAVLDARDPAEAKRLGRGVRSFVNETWIEHRFEIVLGASIAKFGQNQALGAYLLGTNTSVLAEASPTDCVWGIGLEAAHEHAENPLLWRGLNLLGFALMEARSRLSQTGANA